MFSGVIPFPQFDAIPNKSAQAYEHHPYRDTLNGKNRCRAHINCTHLHQSFARIQFLLVRNLGIVTHPCCWHTLRSLRYSQLQPLSNISENQFTISFNESANGTGLSNVLSRENRVEPLNLFIPAKSSRK